MKSKLFGCFVCNITYVLYFCGVRYDSLVMNRDLKTSVDGCWTPEQVHFAVLAIEAAAKKMNVSPNEMQHRLKAQNLIDSYIVKYYNVFHTMSLEHVAEDTIEALLRWENDSNGKGGNV